jgi:lysophospholipase L1-like esterase
MNKPLRHYQRYIAIGDSSTEGLMDLDGEGGFQGWSRRLAARIASLQGGLMYANFGTRGLTTRQILDRQVGPAAAMKPDLVTMFSGTNDSIGPKFDPRSVERDMEQMQRTFTDAGATVLTFTLPDLTPIMPIARLIAPRIHAMNDAVRNSASRTGAICLDFAAYPVATDPRIWHEDRIHANADGHQRIADALSAALNLPGADDSWQHDLPPIAAPSFSRKCLAEIKWGWRHLLPWMVKGMLGSGAREAGTRMETPTLVQFAPARKNLPTA